jgi:protein-S-isoprenylcysteine O-methyltransferase Ste14
MDKPTKADVEAAPDGSKLWQRAGPWLLLAAIVALLVWLLVRVWPLVGGAAAFSVWSVYLVYPYTVWMIFVAAIAAGGIVRCWLPARGLVTTWVQGSVLAVVLLYRRIDEEERMMVGQFGDEYRGYIKRTGRLLPRLTGERD